MNKKSIVPMRSIISVKFIKEAYANFQVSKDGNLVIIIPYNNLKIAKSRYDELKKELNFFDYMCFYCGCWFKEKRVWRDGKRIFCSQKCIDKYMGLRH